MDSDTKILLGVDEAGYGPNLGPLVVVATTLQVPAELDSGSLWDRLGSAVSRWPAKSSDALAVDDSKKVYNSGKGLGALERTVLAWLGQCGSSPRSLREIWNHHCLTPLEDLDEGPWLAGRDLQLPRELSLDLLELDNARLASALEDAGLARPAMTCQIIMPRRYNELVERYDSKGVALFHVGAEILRHIWDSCPASRLQAVFDKQGGRNFYRALLQQQFHETIVLCGREGAVLSQYHVAATGRELDVTFVPKADADHFLVALSSMVAKYLRELCMNLLNDYWTNQVAGLKPTAGYPVDAQRFWQAIAPTVHQRGINPDLVWRHR